MALLSKSAHQVAAETGASYEMARRYARGIAMPTSPEAMQRLAKVIGVVAAAQAKFEGY